MDKPNDTHRHLSHLIGLYPGYALASYNASLQPSYLPSGALANYTHDKVFDAITTSLIHRGNGTGPEADSGWEKVWRAACWAQLMNPDKFYFELSVRSITMQDHATPCTNLIRSPVCDTAQLRW